MAVTEISYSDACAQSFHFSSYFLDFTLSACNNHHLSEAANAPASTSIYSVVFPAPQSARKSGFSYFQILRPSYFNSIMKVGYYWGILWRFPLRWQRVLHLYQSKDLRFVFWIWIWPSGLGFAHLLLFILGFSANAVFPCRAPWICLMLGCC